jgi:hypothetical protein
LPTDVQNAAELISKNTKSLTNDLTKISGPSELPTYRCVDNFTAVEKTEMSLKRNTLVQVLQRHLNGWFDEIFFCCCCLIFRFSRLVVCSKW